MGRSKKLLNSLTLLVFVKSFKLKHTFYFSGWPKEPPLKKPWDQLLTFCLLILSGFLLPILISCFIYLKLIIYKKKMFQNKIEPLETNNVQPIEKQSQFISTELSEMHNVSHNVPQQSENLTDRVIMPDDFFSNSTIECEADIPSRIVPVSEENNKTSEIFSSDEEKMFKMADIERNEAQIMASVRSMKTNLVVGCCFCVFFFVLLVITPKSLQPFFAAICFSTLRAALPILTTVANFGTVQSVVCQYLRSIQKAFHF